MHFFQNKLVTLGMGAVSLFVSLFTNTAQAY